jgi:hypothetical protein
MTQSTDLIERLAKVGLSIDDCVKVGPIGRTRLYQAIKEGELKSRIVCGRRVIMADDFEAFLRGSAANAA